MTTIHCLTGYDRETDVQRLAVPIPAERLPLVRTFVDFSEDDPEGFDSYAITYAQAQRIMDQLATNQIPTSNLSPLSNLAFYIEAFEQNDL
jgi:hypothetical protein